MHFAAVEDAFVWCDCGCDVVLFAGVAIEMSLAKDQSLTAVITGKQDAVLRARKMMTQQLQTQVAALI